MVYVIMEIVEHVIIIGAVEVIAGLVTQIQLIILGCKEVSFGFKSGLINPLILVQVLSS